VPSIVLPSRRFLPPAVETLDPSNQFYPYDGDVYLGGMGLIGARTQTLATTVGGNLYARFGTVAGNAFDASGQSGAAFLSSRSYTPPLNQTIFAVIRPTSWPASGIDRGKIVGGWTQAHLSGTGAPLGANAGLVISCPFQSFANYIPCDACLTYSDGTSEIVDGPATTNSANATKNPWFISISYKDASLLSFYSRDLVTGLILSSSVSKTKSLKQASQPFSIFSSDPNSDTNNSWTGGLGTAYGLYVGWVARAWTLTQLAQLAANPWQIFRPQL